MGSLRRLKAKKAMKTASAMAASTPITMPAIAPPDKPALLPHKQSAFVPLTQYVSPAMQCCVLDLCE